MACVNAATVVLLLGKQTDEFSKKSWYAKFTTTQLSLTKGDVTLDDSQRQFLAQHSVATFLQHCLEWLQHCTNIAALCCVKNRRCESARVTTP